MKGETPPEHRPLSTMRTTQPQQAAEENGAARQGGHLERRIGRAPRKLCGRQETRGREALQYKAEAEA